MKNNKILKQDYSKRYQFENEEKAKEKKNNYIIIPQNERNFWLNMVRVVGIIEQDDYRMITNLINQC